MPDSIAPEAGDEAAYEHYFATLSAIAALQFQIPAADAEVLANEVLLASLRHRLNESNAERWLVGAITSAARGYR
ncbi:MAG TPA: hypothetical protein VGQ76_05615 [Thermoanaerobaculia bacterium]|jgi:hypothetical protein|nr:hypothetical protein [Thermoanaerobaculia bacterium]